MTEYLFSYGTLQQAEVQLKLFGRTLKGSKDILKGYKLLRVEIEDENFLAKGEEKNQLTVTVSDKESDAIEGALLELTPKELLIADAYEPDHYKRVKVQLQSGRHAWIYMVVRV